MWLVRACLTPKRVPFTLFCTAIPGEDISYSLLRQELCHFNQERAPCKACGICLMLVRRGGHAGMSGERACSGRGPTSRSPSIWFVQMVLRILSNSTSHFCGFRAHRSREADDHQVWGVNHGLGSSDRSQTRGLLPDLTIKTVWTEMELVSNF